MRQLVDLNEPYLSLLYKEVCQKDLMVKRNKKWSKETRSMQAMYLLGCSENSECSGLSSENILTKGSVT